MLGGFRPINVWSFLFLQFPGYLSAFIPTFSCKSPKLRILWLRGGFEAVQGPFIGAFRAPLAIRHSHPSNLQLFIFKIEDFMVLGCFWGCLGPLGTVCKGVQTPLVMRLSHHTILRVFQCFLTNFQLSISIFEDFMA